jgi:hypothetical protein
MALAGALAAGHLNAWGLRGHTLANLAAVEAIPADGPVFLKEHKAYIGHLGTIPDTWRSQTEPWLRISEDANHSWYTEGFSFIPKPPHSRTEFILRVYDEYLKVSRTDPAQAKLLNIRYTGLQAYSIIEGYERIKAGMRLYRYAARRGAYRFTDIAKMYAAVSPLYRDAAEVRKMLAADIAFYSGWVGHYVADAAQPLHNSIHHDGWSGDNPKDYTRDPEIHGRFETEYVNLIAVSEADVVKHVPQRARHLDDVWPAVLNHSLEAREFVEKVYEMDKRGAFVRKDDGEAREFTHRRLAAGAAFLRDLIYTAWIESEKPVPPVAPGDAMQNPDNPRFNPATGSAPAK